MNGVFVYFVVTFLILNGYNNELFVASANEEQEIKFYHFLDKDSYQLVNLEKDLDSLKLLSKDSPVYIVVDGFLSHLQGGMSQSVKDALLENRPNSNIFVVDWRKLSGSDSLTLDENLKFTQLMSVYNLAKSKVGLVGETIATFLSHLVHNNLTEYSQVHIIGYSCGAHVAGVAGMTINERYNKTIWRITALDPAGQGFPMSDPNKRLDHTDAEQVHVFHSNRYLAGDMEQHVGHVDVYVNGGKMQPGCISPSLIKTAICNHGFAWKAWNYCMNGKCEACPCDTAECQDCNGECTNGITVGIDISSEAKGDFYLSLHLL